jgi:hypothetical protein
MAISGDYPHPVTVNGFACKNCTDVDNAKRHIDPAHPKDGPYGVNAADKTRGKAFSLGGALAGLEIAGASPARAPAAAVDIRA